MRGPFAQAAEVARRTDDPAPEMLLPDSVHEDAGRQRILRIGNGLGQLLASAPVVELFGIVASDDSQKSPWGRVALIRGVAANVHVEVGWIGLCQSVGRSDWRRSVLLQVVLLRFHA